MGTANDNYGKKDTPEYYREQATKARRAAEECDLHEQVRASYLEIAAGWEELARRAETPRH